MVYVYAGLYVLAFVNYATTNMGRPISLQESDFSSFGYIIRREVTYFDHSQNFLDLVEIQKNVGKMILNQLNIPLG